MMTQKGNALPVAASWALNSDKMGFDGDSIMEDTNSLTMFQAYHDDYHHQICHLVYLTDRQKEVIHD